MRIVNLCIQVLCVIMFSSIHQLPPAFSDTDSGNSDEEEEGCICFYRECDIRKDENIYEFVSDNQWDDWEIKKESYDFKKEDNENDIENFFHRKN